MRKRLNALKTAYTKSKSSRKNLILTVVALIEIIMIMVVSTISWVETTSSLEIKGSGDIDTFTYTTANIGSGGSYSNTAINLSDYFRSAGNVHLASASSADGENIYFPVVASAGSAANEYRKGNVNDKNVNYISFSFNVYAATSSCNFYFADVPTIKIGGDEIANNDVRIAITVSGSTTVYSINEDKTGKVVSSVDGTESVAVVEAFENHTNDDDSNTDVFSVSNGETETVTVTLWLQDSDNSSSYAGKTVTVDDFELVTGSVRVSFVDYTTGFNGAVSDTDSTEANSWHWVDNNSPAMLIFDADTKTSYLMSKDDDFDTNYTWVGRIPQSLLDDSSKTLYFCRCAKGTQSITGLDATVVWNYWEAKCSEAISANSKTYKAYGATQSDDKTGYGTWGDLIEIQVDTEAQTVLPTPLDSISAARITLTNKTNTSVVCEMNYHENLWRGFVPVEKSTVFEFSIYNQTTKKTYTITASNRDDSETVSKFVVTSADTGYWDPPATVEVYVVPDDDGNANGSVSATIAESSYSGTTIKVTAGTTVTLTANPNTGYVLEGWYTDEACENELSTTSVQAPDKNGTAKYYAKFKIQTFTITAYAYTDGSYSSTGGTVLVTGGSSGTTSSATVNYNTSVTYTATVKSGYTFDGWYDSATGGNKVYGNATYTKTITSSANTTLYARFTKNGTTVYFKPNHKDWQNGNERYAAYLWSDSNNYVWYDLTDSDGDGYYSFTYTESYTNIIFVRMNGSTTENNWSNKWNQTKDYTIDNNCFILNSDEGSGDNYTGYWTSYSP